MEGEYQTPTGYTTDTPSYTTSNFSNRILVQIPPPRGAFLLFYSAYLASRRSHESDWVDHSFELWTWCHHSWTAMTPQLKEHLDCVANLESTEHREFWKNVGGGVGVFNGKSLASEEDVRGWDNHAVKFTTLVLEGLATHSPLPGEGAIQDMQLETPVEPPVHIQESSYQTQAPLWIGQTGPDEEYIKHGHLQPAPDAGTQTMYYETPPTIMTEQMASVPNASSANFYGDLTPTQEDPTPFESAMSSASSSSEAGFGQSPPLSLHPHPSTVPLSNRELQAAVADMSPTNQRQPNFERRLSLPTLPLLSDDVPPPFISRMIRGRETHDSNLEHRHLNIQPEQTALDPGTADGSGGTRKGKAKAKGWRWIPYDGNRPRAQRVKRNVGAVAPRLEGQEGFDKPGPSGSTF